MKSFLTYSLIFCMGSFLFSQQQPLYTTQQVKEMAIFPGCEKISASQKKELTHCISQQLSERLMKELKGVEEILRKSDIYDASAQIQFIISKEGIIMGSDALPGSNPVLADAALLAMDRISMELPPIRPAMLKNGTPVNLVLQLPVVFKLEKKSESIASPFYPVDEIVLFTLLTGEDDLRYEVRLFQNKDVKVYEIKNEQAEFLGKFLTLNEVENSEPYKSLINQCKSDDKILVADGFVEKEFFEIYIYNLFDAAHKNPIFVEVMKIENQKRQLVSKFEKESDFNESRYAPLIYR